MLAEHSSWVEGAVQITGLPDFAHARPVGAVIICGTAVRSHHLIPLNCTHVSSTDSSVPPLLCGRQVDGEEARILKLQHHYRYIDAYDEHEELSRRELAEAPRTREGI